MENSEVKNEIKSIVKQISKLHNITKYKFEAKSAVEKGDNFLGDIFGVTIEDEDSKKKLDVVVKLSFKNDNIRSENPIQESYETEIFFYTEIYPRLDEFQKEKHLTDGFQSVPKFYLANTTHKQEAIVMENLKTEGYEIYPKHLIFDDHHNRALFREYARFHALGFAFSDQNPEEYKQLCSRMHNLHYSFISGTGFQSGITSVTKYVYDLLEDDAVKKKFEKYAENGAQMFLDLCELTGGPYTTIVHGDCWSNNFMFKYDKSRNIESVKMLDWQIMKVTSPVFDISYMLYSGGAKETFDKLDKYLLYYYEIFSEFVRQLGSDPERLYPFEILNEHWKKYAIFGMFWSLFLIKIKLTKKEDVVDLKDAQKLEKEDSHASFLTGDTTEYDKRVKELITHLYEIDAL